jgi:hypothetical protein
MEFIDQKSLDFVMINNFLLLLKKEVKKNYSITCSMCSVSAPS